MGARIVVVSFLLLLVASSCRSHIPHSEELDKLFQALAETTDKAQLKGVVTGWINSLDDEVLYKLLIAIQKVHLLAKENNDSPKPANDAAAGVPGPNKPDHFHNEPAQPGDVGQENSPIHNHLPTLDHHHDMEITDIQIEKNLLKMLKIETVAEVKNLLESLDTDEGNELLSKLGVPRMAIKGLLKQLDEDATKAIGTLRIVIQATAGKDPKKLRQLYNLYQLFSLRKQTTEQIQNSNDEELLQLLTALANSENIVEFRNIKFADLLQEFQEKRETDKVKHSIFEWINKNSDLKEIRRMKADYKSANTKPRTLDDTKATIIKKIDRKSAKQLLEFVETLETEKGQELVKSISVPPQPSMADIANKLRTNKQEDIEEARTKLKEWVKQLTLEDIQKVQGAKDLFLAHRIRKTAVENIKKSDANLLKLVLTFLSNKQETGINFGEINIKDLKLKLENNQNVNLEEVKTEMIKWINSLQPEELKALKGLLEKKLTGHLRKKNEGQAELKPVIDLAPPAVGQAELAKAAGDPLINMPNDPVAQENPAAGPSVKNAEEFQTFAMQATKPGPLKVQEAIISVATHGSNEDIKTIFDTAVMGQEDFDFDKLQGGMFKALLARAGDKLSLTTTDEEWTKLRESLKKWVKTWPELYLNLFLEWYINGIEKL